MELSKEEKECKEGIKKLIDRAILSANFSGCPENEGEAVILILAEELFWMNQYLKRREIKIHKGEK